MTKWHVLPEDSVDLNKALQSVHIDEDSIREKIDKYLREVVVERLDFLNMTQRIDQQLERRIEIAIKGAVDRISGDMVVRATEQVRARLKAEIDKLPIALSVVVGSP